MEGFGGKLLEEFLTKPLFVMPNWGKVVYNITAIFTAIPLKTLIFTYRYMNKYTSAIEFKHQGDSALFNHFSKFFDEFVIEEFRRKHDADTSFKGHKAMILQIEAYVTDNIKIESKEDYANLVDTLKLLSENDD